MLYDVQFPDGSIKPYSANIIAENILMQADGDGLHHQLLEGILDHSKDKREIENKDKYLYPSVAIHAHKNCWLGFQYRICEKTYVRES